MNTTAVFVLGGAVLILVALTLYRMIQCCRELRSYRHDVNDRLSKLRIHKMLARLGISRSRYLHAVNSIDTERHLFICERCPDPDACDKYLDEGKAGDPAVFCPNHPDFAGLMSKIPVKQH